MANPSANIKRVLTGAGVAVLLVLVSAPDASAGPITPGVWSSVPSAQNDLSSFWDGQSWDCPTCNVGFVLAGYTGLSELEFLSDGLGSFVPFAFNEPTIELTKIFSNTAWTNGVLGRDANGAFTYDSGTGRFSNSWLSPQQYALFRRVGSETTQYFMGIEDILIGEALNDRDYNDYGVTFTLPNAQVVSPEVRLEEPESDPEPPVPVPEPSTLALLGISIFGLAGRRARRLIKTSVV